MPVGWTATRAPAAPAPTTDRARLDQSRQMLLDSAHGGTRLLFVTPHLDARMPMTPARIDALDEAFAVLVELARDVPDAPELRLAYEVAPRPGSDEVAGDPTRFVLPGTDVVLVDGPDDVPMAHDDGIVDYLDRVLSHGLRPVLAHPERRAATHPGDHGFAPGLKARGALLQVDAGAFLGIDGAAARSEAYRLLDAGLVDLIASDAHEVGEADLTTVHDLLLGRIGSTATQLLDGTALEVS